MSNGKWSETRLYVQVVEVGQFAASLGDDVALGLVVGRGGSVDFVQAVVLGVRYRAARIVCGICTVTALTGWGWYAIVYNFEVIASIVFGTESPEQSTQTLGGGTALADNATEIFGVYRQLQQDTLFVNGSLDNDFIGVTDQGFHDIFYKLLVNTTIHG
jgi:hypothetical protein